MNWAAGKTLQASLASIASISSSERPMWWPISWISTCVDDRGEGDVAALGPFVQDRPSVEEDARGLRRRLDHRAAAQVGALVEAGKLEGVLDPELGKGLSEAKSSMRKTISPAARRIAAGRAAKAASASAASRPAPGASRSPDAGGFFIPLGR